MPFNLHPTRNSNLFFSFFILFFFVMLSFFTQGAWALDMNIISSSISVSDSIPVCPFQKYDGSWYDWEGGGISIFVKHENSEQWSLFCGFHDVSGAVECSAQNIPYNRTYKIHSHHDNYDRATDQYGNALDCYESEIVFYLDDPNQNYPDEDRGKQGDCSSEVGSYVNERSRIFHEDILIPGTDIFLHYASNRVEGYMQVFEIPVNALQITGVNLTGGVVTVSNTDISTMFGRSFSPDQNNHIQISWNIEGVKSALDSRHGEWYKILHGTTI